MARRPDFERSSAVIGALTAAGRAGLWSPGDRLLVGVSGGPDSTALLHALATRREALGLGAVVAGHVDHGLRPESAEEARQVARLAEGLGCEVRVVRVRVGGPGGPQAAARRARYAALEDVRRETGCARIATAHTADDQAETLLLRLARGTSLAGLGGIPAVRDRIVRPLLGCRRDDLAAWCAAHDLPTVEDPSNRDPRYRRVRVRTELLPLLEARLNPAVVEALARLARLAAEDEAVLAAEADALRRRATGALGLLNGRILGAAPPALARRVLAHAWRAAAGGDLDPVEAAHLEALLALATGDGPRRRLTLPGGVLAERSLGRVALVREAPAPLAPTALPGPGRYPLEGLGAVELAEAEPSGGGVRVAAGPGLWVRGPRPGDRLPSGRKVARFLAERGVPACLRPRAPVLVRRRGDAEAVLAVLDPPSPTEAPDAGPLWAVRLGR